MLNIKCLLIKKNFEKVEIECKKYINKMFLVNY